MHTASVFTASLSLPVMSRRRRRRRKWRTGCCIHVSRHWHVSSVSWAGRTQSTVKPSIRAVHYSCPLFCNVHPRGATKKAFVSAVDVYFQHPRCLMLNWRSGFYFNVNVNINVNETFSKKQLVNCAWPKIQTLFSYLYTKNGILL